MLSRRGEGDGGHGRPTLASPPNQETYHPPDNALFIRFQNREMDMDELMKTIPARARSSNVARRTFVHPRSLSTLGHRGDHRGRNGGLLQRLHYKLHDQILRTQLPALLRHAT